MGLQISVQLRRGRGAGGFQAADLLPHGLIFFPDFFRLFLRNQADAAANLRQTLVGVVLTVEQTVFAAGGHDAVGLLGTLGHKVIDEGADIAVGALEDQRLTAQQLQRRVDARHKALHRRLLVAGGAVELPRTVEAGDLFRLQSELKLGRIDAVIFDGVGGAEHFRVLQTGHGVQHGKLHVLRQAGGKALQVHFVRVQAAGL